MEGEDGPYKTKNAQAAAANFPSMQKSSSANTWDSLSLSLTWARLNSTVLGDSVPIEEDTFIIAGIGVFGNRLAAFAFRKCFLTANTIAAVW